MSALASVDAGWDMVDADGKFTFSLPKSLVPVEQRSVDSLVRRWEGKQLAVHFDYGRYADPLITYRDKKGYRGTTAQIDNHPVSVVEFERDHGWRFTAVHFSDLGSDLFGQTVKLTVVAESGPNIEKDIPWRILRSVRFGR
jgi:hypothetical protein